jgi:hypothetical protein
MIVFKKKCTFVAIILMFNKMARVTTKTDLATTANGQFEKLWKPIDSIKKHTITVR